MAEYSRYEVDVDFRQGEIVSAGVDLGSVDSKAVIMVDGRVSAQSVVSSGYLSPDGAQKALSLAMKESDMKTDDIHFTVGTGFGHAEIPFANKIIRETACHATGAIHIFGDSVRTILDIGGHECNVISCDGRGRVLSYVPGRDCAAFTGRGLEVFYDFLGVDINEDAPFLMNEDDLPDFPAACVVSARSEASRMLDDGISVEKVLSAYMNSMACNLAILVEDAGLEEDLAVTGGVGSNTGIVERLEKELGIKALRPVKDIDPGMAGALGAAIIAGATVLRMRRNA